MKISWGFRNIIHLVLFGIYVIVLLAKLLIVGSDPSILLGLLCISFSTVLFLVHNSKIILRAGAPLIIDVFLVIAITGLFLF